MMKKKMMMMILISVLLFITVFCGACNGGKVNLNLGESTGLQYFLLPDGTYEVSIGTSEDKNIGIPGLHNGIAVSQIKEDGFKGSGIVSIVLPDSLTKVADYAFEGCKKLKIVTTYSDALARNNGASAATIDDILDNVKEEGFFGNGAFSDCENLEELLIPEGVITIGTACVQNGTNLKRVVMPNSVKYIFGAAFEGCDNIEDFVFSDNIEFLGMGAFYNTKWLETHEDGCVYVGKCLYQYKGDVPTEITVREGTVEISTEFCSSYYPTLTLGLSNLTTVNCNAELERIAAKAFQDCTNLEFVNFIGTAPEIGVMAFYNTKYRI